MIFLELNLFLEGFHKLFGIFDSLLIFLVSLICILQLICYFLVVF